MADTEVVTKNIVKNAIKEPPRYKVIVLNDDVTTMEFVIAMLTKLFHHTEEQALSLTLEIHTQGSAVAGTYTYQIAEQKVIDSITMARNHGFPLIVKAEQE